MSSSNGDHRFYETMHFTGGMENTPTVRIEHVEYFHAFHARQGKSKRMVTFLHHDGNQKDGYKPILSVSLETLKEICDWVSYEDNTK